MISHYEGRKKLKFLTQKSLGFYFVTTRIWNVMLDSNLSIFESLGLGSRKFQKLLKNSNSLVCRYGMSEEITKKINLLVDALSKFDLYFLN